MFVWLCCWFSIIRFTNLPVYVFLKWSSFNSSSGVSPIIYPPLSIPARIALSSSSSLPSMSFFRCVSICRCHLDLHCSADLSLFSEFLGVLLTFFYVYGVLGRFFVDATKKLVYYHHLHHFPFVCVVVTFLTRWASWELPVFITPIIILFFVVHF